MASVKLYRDARRRGCICLQFCNRAGSAARHYLPFEVEEKFWDAARSRVVLHPDRDRMNASLQRVLVRAQDELVRLVTEEPTKGLTSAQVRDCVCALVFKEEVAVEVESPSRRLVDVFEEFARAHKASATVESYLLTLLYARRYDLSFDSLSFEDVDVAWLRGFEAFLGRTNKSANSRSIHLRNLRAVFNYALDGDLTSWYPFRKFRFRGAPTMKRDLPLDDLRTLLSYKGEPWEEKYVDTFRASFLLLGINMKDLCSLTGANVRGDRLRYIRAKTGKAYDVKLYPDALELLGRYRGERLLWSPVESYANYKNFLNRCNRNMKAICKKIGVPAATTYSMRHSMASLMAELDVPKEVIGAALGHELGNRTTSIYIDFNQKKVDDANRLLLDYVLRGMRVSWEDRKREA